MSLEDTFNMLMEICEAHNAKSVEDVKNLLYNADGTRREDIWGPVLENIRNEMSENEIKYVPLDLSDFSKLSDDELYDEMPTFVFGADELNEKQHIALVTYEFEMEFANGGVSQYFGNTSGEHIDELCNCLRIIGAENYAKKCEDFINKYNIKSSDFIKAHHKKIESMYPYNELEDAIMHFYYDDPLSKYLVDYVRANEVDFKIEE